MRSIALILSSVALAFACDSGSEPAGEEKEFKKAKRLGDLKQDAKEPSPEELAEARKKAGFKSNDEIAAENAAIFEKGAREYVKTRVKEYRAFVTAFRKHVDGLEKSAPKWVAAKDPAAAVEKYRDDFKPKFKEFTAEYDTMTGHGAEGGETQVMLGRAFRTFEDLHAEMGPELASDPRFAEVLKTIRTDLDALSAALDAIEKDESLVINESYSASGKKKPEAADPGPQ